MMLGGIDENGNEVYNLLSALSLKASYNNKLIDPKINLRVSKNTPAERYTEATELTKVGLGFPQYSNDDIVIPALEALGYEHNDAVNYTVAACWEFIIPNVGGDVANIGAMSYPKTVDRAFHNELIKSETFDEFFDSVKNEIAKESNDICDNIKNLWFVPSPFMNVLMDCDIYNGGKYNNFGIHGTGIATATDSLAAIKKYIFEEKSITKADYIKAVDENFENDPELLHKLRYEAPKVGNNDDFADSIATELLDTFANSLKGKTNCRGGLYRAGTGSAMFYLRHAEEIGASADGRRKGEPYELIEELQDCHLCIETSGYAHTEIFKSVVEKLDFIIMYIKVADSNLHKKYTGVDNEIILKNFGILKESGKPYLIRTPLIPDITDTKENLDAIKNIIGTSDWERLPYNKMAGAKYKMLGMSYEL